MEWDWDYNLGFDWDNAIYVLATGRDGTLREQEVQALFAYLHFLALILLFMSYVALAWIHAWDLVVFLILRRMGIAWDGKGRE